jgi:uncharacterized protein (DUF362 family)
VIPVGLVRCDPAYEAGEAPWPPGVSYPELARLAIRAGTAPNRGYAAVRAALAALGLDAGRHGSAGWNPLGKLVCPGGRVVLKPNFIRHWNPREGHGGSIDSVITHGSIVRAVADYAFLAVGSSGRVIVAEAPQQDCSFAEIRRLTGLDRMVEDFAARGLVLEVVDLRREEVRFADGVIVERKSLPGDPEGYRAVDLGDASFFCGAGLDPRGFRGADYDPTPTVTHHTGGRHAYLLSETVLRAELLVNLPKLKTHKKTGVTLALKNLVGINGDKNWLPHHTVGAPEDGGDEYPQRRFPDGLRSRAVEWARPWLRRGAATGLFRAARRLERAVRGDDFVRSGNWHGNQTTWRMSCDLNRCVLYSDREGLHLDSPRPVRTVLTILDGIIAGEGEGPLAPWDVPLGAVIAGTDAVAVDLVAVRLMGFDARRIPKIEGAMRSGPPRITRVRDAGQVRVEVRRDSGDVRESVPLEALRPAHAFRPHSGWIGMIEEVPA